jgi:transcription elongation factor Elf1
LWEWEEERKRRKKMTKGFLTCSICGSDVIVSGKDGAIILTECPNCGMNSNSMVPFRQEREKKEVQIMYRRQAS